MIELLYGDGLRNENIAERNDVGKVEVHVLAAKVRICDVPQLIADEDAVTTSTLPIHRHINGAKRS